MEKSPIETRGGGGRGRRSGRGSGGRNPWGGRARSSAQTFSGSAGIVKPGTNIIWSKWLAGAKETLRTQYGSQVESLERILPEEKEPKEKPELTSAALSNKANIELFRHEMKAYEDWERKAELRKGIRLALLDKCNQQVKKVLFANHAIETIENLTCQVTDLVAWIRHASKDPTLSTYAKREKAKSDWVNAKQFLSESDEAWGERLTSLADALEDSGAHRPTGSDIGNKYIMASDSTRHSEARDRHEEHLNAIRTDGVSDEVWIQFTQPVESLDQAILKLRSVKQRVIPAHIVETHETVGDRPKSRQEERKKHLKSQGKRDQSKKASGSGAVSDRGETCLLCDKYHSTKSCRFLSKCRKLLVDTFKASKEETAAVAEESDDSTGDEICFMVHENPTGTSSSSEILDIPDLVDDSDSEEENFQMHSAQCSDEPNLPNDSYSKLDSVDDYIYSTPLRDDLALLAQESDNTVIVDTGASLNIFPDALGYPKIRLPQVRVRSVHGVRTLSTGINHHIWGEIYVDPNTTARILSFGKLVSNKDFEVMPDKGGTFQIYHVPTANTLQTYWRGRILVATIPNDFGENNLSLDELVCTVQAALDNPNSDKYADVRGMSMAQLRQARAIRSIHRGFAFRDTQALAKLVNNGWVRNMPISVKLFRMANELLGTPHEEYAAKARTSRTPSFKDYANLKDNEVGMELDIMTWFGHTFLVAVLTPTSFTRVVYLGKHGVGEHYKNKEKLISAYLQIHAFVKSYQWNVRVVIFDGEKAMATDEFLYAVRNTGAKAIPLPKGRKAHRVERKQGTIKANARVLKQIFPTSIPLSFVPHLVQSAVMQTNCNVCRSNEQGKPPILLFERIPAYSFDRFCSPAFGDMCLTHKEDAVPDKAQRYTAEAIALYPADTPEEGFWFYLVGVRQLVKRATYKPCQVYSESIIRALLDLVKRDSSASATLQRPSYDFEPLSTLTLESANAKRTATVAQAVEDIVVNTEANTTDDFFDTCAAEVDIKSFNKTLTLRKGLQVYGETAKKSIEAEIEGIIDREVWEGVHWKQLSKTQRKKILREKVIVQEKRTPAGVFNKIKSRLVVLGNLQKEADIGDEKLTSPTPSIHTILIQATRAAAENREVITFDVGQAFLNAQLESSGKEHIVLRLSAPVADILVNLDSSYKQYMCIDGTMLVKLKKALYGLRQAPRVWFDTIRAFLIHNGFQQSKLDDCFFWKTYPDEKSIDISIHVDDGLVTTNTMTRVESLLAALKEKFKIITTTRGLRHEYLSMVLVFNRESRLVEITMPRYAQKILDDYPHKYKSTTTPHDKDLFKISESKALSKDEQTLFHSTVMRILFYASRVRPDILATVNFLTTRTRFGTATNEDKRKLTRLLNYIYTTQQDGIMLGGDSNGNLRLRAYADASYGVHMDGKSHTGNVITLGRGPIFCKSSKQRSVTKSSCEAEILALSDIVSTVAWMNDFLLEISVTSEPPILLEDNKAAIFLVTHGSSTAGRVRHVHIRNAFVNQFITNGTMKIIFCPTSQMIADILTKPLSPPIYSFLRKLLLGYEIHVFPEQG